MASSDTMGPSPSKKRRIAPRPKDRTTEYLDLTKPDCDFDAMDQARRDRLVEALRRKKKIVVIAGAGISVSADIPDFRSSQGLFAAAGRQTQKLKASGKHLFDAAVYKRDALTEEFHTMVREMAALAEKAEPTPFHNLLASLAQEGRLLRLYSQNIDCIDTSMKPLATNVPLNPKGPWPATIQLHGGLEKMVCIKCGNLQQLQPGLFEGPEAPLCKSCIEDDEIRTSFAGKRSHGIGRLRPRFVLYNEYNPDEEAIGNVCRADLKARPDAVIVVGTSLKVPGTRRLVKELCQVTRSRRGGFTAWINVESEPKGVEFRDCWDMVVKSRCDVVAREVDLPPWDCAIGDDYHVSPEKASEIQRRWSMDGRSAHFEVQFPTKSKQAEEEQAKEEQAKEEPVKDEQGIPTPKPSPTISPVGKSNKARNPKPAKATPKPAKKTKQSKLPFGDQKTGESKVTKPAKKAGTGKRGHPLKATQPKSTVLDSFKSGKNVQHDELLKEVDSSKSSDAIENIEPQRVALPSLRPDQPKAAYSPMYKAPSTEAAEIPSNDDTDSSRPPTPAKAEKPCMRETISPTSCPKGLRMLID